jgi:hypothetical protein
VRPMFPRAVEVAFTRFGRVVGNPDITQNGITSSGR